MKLHPDLRAIISFLLQNENLLHTLPCFKEQLTIKIKLNSRIQINLWAGIAQPVQRLATGWKVRGSNLGGERFSAPVQAGPVAYPASCTMGTGSFPGVKRPKRGADHPPHLCAEVIKGEGYTSTHPSGLSGLLQGKPLPLPTQINLCSVLNPVLFPPP